MLLDPVYERVSSLVGAPAEQLKVRWLASIPTFRQRAESAGHHMSAARLPPRLDLRPTASQPPECVALVLARDLCDLLHRHLGRHLGICTPARGMCGDVRDRSLVAKPQYAMGRFLVSSILARRAKGDADLLASWVMGHLLAK